MKRYVAVFTTTFIYGVLAEDEDGAVSKARDEYQADLQSPDCLRALYDGDVKTRLASEKDDYLFE